MTQPANEYKDAAEGVILGRVFGAICLPIAFALWYLFFALVRHFAGADQHVLAYVLLGLTLLLAFAFSYWSWVLLDGKVERNLLHPYAYYAVGAFLIGMALITMGSLAHIRYGLPAIFFGLGIIWSGHKEQIARQVARRKQRLREQQAGEQATAAATRLQ